MFLAAWSSEDLLRWGILFFLFVLPALKGILESRKRAAEEAGRPRSPRPRPEPSEEDDDPWGRLLRGETLARPTPPPPVVPTALPRSRSVEPAPARRSIPIETFEAPPFAGDLKSEPLFELESASSSGRDLPPLASLGELSIIEGAGLVPARNVPRGALGAAVDPGVLEAVDAAANDWLRAVILSEVLAAPLALRGDGGAPALHASH